MIAAPVASAVNMSSVLSVQPNLPTNQVAVSEGKQAKPKATTKRTKRLPKPPSQAAIHKKMQQQPLQHQQQQQYLQGQPGMMFGQSTQQPQQQQQPYFQQSQQQRGLQQGLQPQAQQRWVEVVHCILIKSSLRLSWAHMKPLTDLEL